MSNLDRCQAKQKRIQDFPGAFQFSSTFRAWNYSHIIALFRIFKDAKKPGIIIDIMPGSNETQGSASRRNV